MGQEHCVFVPVSLENSNQLNFCKYLYHSNFLTISHLKTTNVIQSDRQTQSCANI